MRIRHTNDGFTIVELLVVVAIIVVLLSILLPAVDKAMEHARVAKCLSNEKHMYIAFRGYTLDFQDRGFNSRNWHRWHVPASQPLSPVPLPVDAPANDSEGTASTSISGQGSEQYISPTHVEAYWAASYRPYGGTKGLYYCPSATAVGDTSATDGKFVDGHKFTTYSLNGVRSTDMATHYGSLPAGTTPFFINNSDTSPAVVFSSIKAQANVVFVMDHYEARFDANGDLPVPTLPTKKQWAAGSDQNRQNWRHMEGAALLWGDGHATHYAAPSEQWDIRWFTGAY